jgi:hypothetical protein
MGLRGCSSKHRKDQRIITCINCSCSNCCYSGFILHPKKTLSSWWPMPSNAILLLPQLPSHLSIAIAWASSSVGATLGPNDARCPSPRGGTAHVAQRQEHQLVNGIQFTSCPCTYQLYNRVHRMIDHLHLSCHIPGLSNRQVVNLHCIESAFTNGDGWWGWRHGPHGRVAHLTKLGITRGQRSLDPICIYHHLSVWMSRKGAGFGMRSKNLNCKGQPKGFWLLFVQDVPCNKVVAHL